VEAQSDHSSPALAEGSVLPGKAALPGDNILFPYLPPLKSTTASAVYTQLSPCI